MSDPIIRMSEANIRTFDPIVRYFDAAISMSDPKVSMSTPAMRMIGPILLIFISDLRINGTVQRACALTQEAIISGAPYRKVLYLRKVCPFCMHPPTSPRTSLAQHFQKAVPIGVVLRKCPPAGPRDRQRAKPRQQIQRALYETEQELSTQKSALHPIVKFSILKLVRP